VLLMPPSATALYTLSLHDALPILRNRRFPDAVAVIARDYDRIASGIDTADHADMSAAAAPSHHRDGAKLRSRHALAVARERTRRSEEHTSELQSQSNLVCRLLLEK